MSSQFEEIQSFMTEKTWLCRSPHSYIVFTENFRKWVKAIKPGLDPREPLTAAKHHLLKILNPSKITPPPLRIKGPNIRACGEHSTFKPYHYMLLKLSYNTRSSPCEEPPAQLPPETTQPITILVSRKKVLGIICSHTPTKSGNKY